MVMVSALPPPPPLICNEEVGIGGEDTGYDIKAMIHKRMVMVARVNMKIWDYFALKT